MPRTNPVLVESGREFIKVSITVRRLFRVHNSKKEANDTPHCKVSKNPPKAK